MPPAKSAEVRLRRTMDALSIAKNIKYFEKKIEKCGKKDIRELAKACRHLSLIKRHEPNVRARAGLPKRSGPRRNTPAKCRNLTKAQREAIIPAYERRRSAKRSARRSGPRRRPVKRSGKRSARRSGKRRPSG